MKIIVADKISDRGVQLLEQQPGWSIVLTTKETLDAEMREADAFRHISIRWGGSTTG